MCDGSHNNINSYVHGTYFSHQFFLIQKYHIDGFVQDYSIAIANALENTYMM